MFEKQLFYAAIALLAVILLAEVILIAKYRNTMDSTQYTRFMDIIISSAALVVAGYFGILCYLQK